MKEEDEASSISELTALRTRVETLERQLSTIHRLTKAGTWELEVPSMRMVWSKEMFDIFGREYTPVLEVDLARSTIFTPSSMAALRPAIERAIERAEGYELVLEAIHSNGELRTVVSRCEPICGADGKVIRLAGTLQDVTARERDARAFRDLLSRYELATSSAQVGIWEYDLRAERIRVSGPMDRIFDRAPDDWTLDSWRKAVHEDDSERMGALTQTCIVEGTPFDTVLRIVSAVGKVKSIHTHVMRDTSDPARPRLIGVSWDVTDMVNAQEALRQSAALQRAILAHAGAAIIAANELGIINIFNPAAEKLLGYSAAEIIGQMTPRPFYVESEVAARRIELREKDGITPTSDFDVFVAKARRDGPETREWTFVRKDGTRLPVLLTVSVTRDTRGALVGYLGVAVDLSSQKATEEQLRSLNRLLEKRSVQMEVLLQEIHHRVKNNLQVITSMVNMQARQAPDASTRAALADSHARINAISLIHEQLYRANDYSQIPFHEYVGQLADKLLLAAGVSERIGLELDTEPVRLSVAAAIPCGLVLNELLTNAIKHAFPGDRRGRIRVSFRGVKAERILEVSDNGVGIPEGVVPARAESLGMQLVSDLAAQLRGRLEIGKEDGARIRLVFNDELPAGGENHEQ